MAPSPPPPPNAFASQSIRIPTFASPLTRAPPDSRPKTREEERLGRLKGPTQQWSAFSSLMTDAPALPSHLLARTSHAAPPPPPKRSSAPRSNRGSQIPFIQPRNPATPAASSRPPSSRSSARRSAVKRAALEVEGARATEEDADAGMEDVVEVVSVRKASGGRRGSARGRPGAVEEAPVDVEELWSEGEEEDEDVAELIPTKKVSGGRRGSTRGCAIEMEEAPSPVEERWNEADEQQQEKEEEEQVVPIPGPSRQISERRVDPVASGSGTRRQPVASGSGTRAAAPDSKTASTATESLAKAKPQARTSKKRKSKVVVEKEGNIKKRATKRPQKPNPPRSPSPDLSDGDQALPYAPHAASDDDESDQDKSGKGLRIRSERLKGNKGRLNAVDVVYGGIRQLLQLKISGMKKGKTGKAVQRYSELLQVLFLNQSDQTSSLSKVANQVSAARSTAKQLRNELLGVQRARAGVGRRMRAEEKGWQDGRAKAETTRSLHSFLSDLSSASLDWNNAAAGSRKDAPQVDDGLEPRLQRMLSTLGSGGGTLARRVERLNTELVLRN